MGILMHPVSLKLMQYYLTVLSSKVPITTVAGDILICFIIIIIYFFFFLNKIRLRNTSSAKQ